MPKSLSEFQKSLAIRQVGAKTTGVKGIYQVGEGFFTEKQVVESSLRLGKMKLGYKR